MKTLFIDSSRKSLSVALANDNKLLFVSNINSYSKHSNFLMNEIVNILNKVNITLNEVDNIVVLNGPGSFTGIRVGVTIAKTLAWASNIKLYLLTTLEALKLHSSLESKDVIISVFYDKQNDSYVGVFDNNKKTLDYLNIDDDIFNIDNRNVEIISYEENDFVKQLYDKLSINNNVNTKIISDYDYIKVINYALLNEPVNTHLAEPIYLKKIDAEKKKNDTRL